jgi:hypothetical protein
MFFQIKGSYIQRIAYHTLSTATCYGESPFFGYISFFGFGFSERAILSISPDSFLTDKNKNVFDNKKLVNSRMFAAMQLTTFLLCGGLYYKNGWSKNKFANGLRIFGDFLALCNIIVSFDLIYHSAKEKQ